MFTRTLPIVFALLLASLGFGQGEAPPKVAIQALISVREHNTGAEYVQIRMNQPGYPAKLLQEQITRLGEELGVAPRGVTIQGKPLETGAKLNVLTASFAIDGLLAPGSVNLAPLLRAMTGAPEPFTVENIQVLLEGVLPDKSTVRTYAKAGILKAEAVYLPNPSGMEYRIRLETQDPAAIEFPDRYVAPVKEKPKKEAKTTDDRPLLIGLFMAAGLALGALVYFALTRPSGKRG